MISMENNLISIKRTIIFLLILTMVLGPVANSISLATSEQRVKVTHVPSMLWGGFGQYVEYELDGIKYRTDQASSATNRQAWSLMNQEDKRKTYDRLHTKAAKQAAFGEDGWQDVVSWIRETNEWFVANRMWKEKIAKKSFPGLYEVYGDGKSLSNLFGDFDEMKNYIPPSIVSNNNMVREEFIKKLGELEDYYNVGKDYYTQVKDMRGRSIGKVATFTMMQCSQMLSDMLFLPSISNLASIPRSGLISDLIGVLQTTAGVEGGDLLEKLNAYLEGGQAVQLTVSEQIKLYESLVKTYAVLAENYYKKTEEKIVDLRNSYERLVDIAKDLKLRHQKKAEEKETEKNNYKTGINESIILPPEKDPEPEDPTVTLAFKWKTEEELKNTLFNNDLDGWLEFYGDLEKARDLVFAEIIAQKNALDAESYGKLELVSNRIKEAYRIILSEVENLETEISTLDIKHREIIELYYDLDRIPIADTYFNGKDKFSPDLENFGNTGLPYDHYYSQLRDHIEGNKEKIDNLLDTTIALKDQYPTFYKEIITHIQDLSFYLNLLSELEQEYSGKYNKSIWKLKNKTGLDTSNNYSMIAYINPYESQDYTGKDFATLLEIEKINPNDYNIEEISINRPKNVFSKAYDIYETFKEAEYILQEAYKDIFINQQNYLEQRKNYYQEIDSRLDSYLNVQDKMEGAFVKIRNMVDQYESFWENTYFQGSYDNYAYQRYLYGTGLISISAFDVEGLRSYIRGGGSTSILYNKLKNIERKAESNEALVADLVGQIESYNIEMNLLIDTELTNYAATKNKIIKNFYQLRAKYGLDDLWLELTVNPENSLFYFNTCDISRICEILNGETEEIIFLKDSIKTIRNYKDKDSVDIHSTSNNLYDIYKRATAIKDMYMGNMFSTYGLQTDEYKTEILDLYANPNDGDDILNSISELKRRHEGINYTYPPSPYQGIDEYTQVGEPTSKAIIPGTANIQANIYHPLAVNATSIDANLYLYDDGWSLVDTISRSLNDKSADIIDKDKDLLSMKFTNLEDGREYRVEWEITHSPYGTALYENGEYNFTYTSPKGVFTSVELNKDTYDSVDITIINNSDRELVDEKMYVDGYDHEGNLVLTEVEYLTLQIGQKTTVSVDFEEAVYQVEVHIEGLVNPDPEEFESWPIEETVDKNKVWRIKFNLPVDQSTVTKGNIYIKNEMGQILDIIPELDELDEKGQTIILNPPEETYVEGSLYTLYISRNIRSRDGKKLTNGVKMKFYIE